MSRRTAMVAVGLLLAVGAPIAQAHKPSDAYLTVRQQDATLTGRWDIALRDLEAAVGLDANGDGEITWGEVRAQRAAIIAYALSRLDVRSGGAACPLRVEDLAIDRHTDGAYAVLVLAGGCAAAGSLAIAYTLLFDLDPQHRGLLHHVEGGTSRSLIFTSDARRQVVGGGAAGWWQQFRTYLREGVWHIWLGFDHVLFLLSLLLPAVLVRVGGRWTAALSLRSVVIDVAKVVTAFTLAHSITLSAAVLGVLTVPSRWVESTIALTVVLAALNNVWPVVTGGRWAAAFVLGLVHGFGFAGALLDLGLPPGALAGSLLGFNLGVEIGQLAIVAPSVPLAFALRGSWAYRRLILGGGSLAIAVIAGVWLVERWWQSP